MCQPAQNELLNQCAEHSLARGDREVLEYQSKAAVRLRIVQIGQSRRTQVSTDAGVIGLPLAAISPADEWGGHRVVDAGFRRPSTLIVVARILSQQRWQDGASNQNVRKAVSSSSAHALAVAAPTLRVIRPIPSLIDGRKRTHSGDRKSVSRCLQRKVELQLRSKRRRIRIIDHIKVWDDT